MGCSLIERPEARYRIVYGRHTEITPVSELPPHFDALLLEGGSLRYSEIEIEDGISLKNFNQYLRVVESAQRREVKIYFGDVPLREFPFRLKVGKMNFPPDWSAALRMGEFYGGWVLAVFLAKEIDQKKNISRRDFLKRIGKGAAVAWSMSWFSKLGTVFFKEGREVPRTLEKIISAEDLIHPEDLSTRFRNAVVAKKLITIGKREQTEHNRKAEIVAVFGGGHTGLAEFLRQGEEACQKVVKLYPKWFLKAMIAEGNLDYLSLIIGAKFNPRYGLWIVSDRFFDGGLYNLVSQEQEYSSARKEVR